VFLSDTPHLSTSYASYCGCGRRSEFCTIGYNSAAQILILDLESRLRAISVDHISQTIAPMSDLSSKAPIRVGIDGRILMQYEMRGFARYTVEVFRALKEIAGDAILLYSFSPGPIAPEFRDLLDLTPVVFPSRREILWEQIELPKQIRKARIDVFHATANRGLPYRRVCQYVVTCHDIIDRLPAYCAGEHWRGVWRKRYADFISRHSAGKYITVSHFSKQDIVRFHGVADERVVAIYNAAHPRFYETLPEAQIALVRNKYLLPDSYFLFLGGFDHRKNVRTLVDAVARLPKDLPPLVLAGEHKWGFPEIAKQISAFGLSQRVFCPGNIADDDLPAVYQGALALVHPSRYEGFGLQLVEAMASGVPVLASETTSLPEVLGGSGLLFDPEDAGSIASQMERIARDPILWTATAERGRQRAHFFSWHKAAEETLKVYLELLRRGDCVGDECGEAAAASEHRQ
jgi:glycosyltransferase involved in cell wall biosynthesis